MAIVSQPGMIWTTLQFGMSGLLIATCAVLLYAVGLMIYNVFFHPLRSYPGPLLWRATRLPYDYHRFRGTLNFKIREMHNKYGEIVRVSPSDLTFASTQAVHDILA